MLKSMFPIDYSLNYGRFYIRKYLKASLPFQNVIDIGAGSGSDLMIAKEINHNAILYGVEVDDNKAKELKKAGHIIDCLNIERDKLPFVDCSIDVVIANQIFEHTKDIFWICHEISRVLVVGGKLILGVPNLAAFHNRLLLLFGKQPASIKNNSAHIRGFTKDDIISFFNICFPRGYSLIAFNGSNFYPFPPAIAMSLSKLFPTGATSIFFLLLKKEKYNRQFMDYLEVAKLETNFYMGGNYKHD